MYVRRWYWLAGSCLALNVFYPRIHRVAQANRPSNPEGSELVNRDVMSAGVLLCWISLWKQILWPSMGLKCEFGGKKLGRISRCFQYTTNLKLQLHPRQTKTWQSGYYKKIYIIYIRIHPVSALEFLLHERPEVSRRWVVGHLVPHAVQAILP